MVTSDCFPTSTMCHEAGTFSAGIVLYSAPWVTSLAITTSVGRMSWTPRSSAAAMIRRASSTRSGSARLFPTLLPWARMNVLAIPPPTMRMSTLFEQVLEDLDLVGDLGAADDRDVRARRVLDEPRQVLDLLLHQEAGVRPAGAGQSRRSRRGRGGRCRTRRSRRRRRTTPSAFANSGSFFSSSGWKRRFSRSSDLARPQAADRVLGPDAQRVAGARDVEAEQRPTGAPPPAEPEAVLDLAVGAAEVAREDHARALVQEVLDRGDGRPDPGVVA